MGKSSRYLVIQEAPQAQKMLKNKSYWNWMKPTPLRPTRRVDSGHIFTFSNGLYMRELSHSDHFLKHLKSQNTGKKSMLTSTWHHQRHLMMQNWINCSVTSGSSCLGRCGWHIKLGLDMWQSSGKCGGATWPRHGQPHGTQSTVLWLVSKFLRSMGFETKTTHQAKHLKERTNTIAPHMSLVK